jgi:hypothetical protein
VDETRSEQGPTAGPGWLDDPFHRSGQRWWDGREWTARTRPAAGAPASRRHSTAGRASPPRREQLPPRETAGPSTPSRPALPSLRSYTRVIVGVLLAVTLIGLLAPSAEESGAASEGYRRAAYWSCADLLTQRLGPSIDLEFPGDSAATISNQNETWDVRGRVDIVSDLQPAARTWRCTVTHDNGDWRGTAALD